ncbi:MAG: hypothetical protein WBC44_20220 [Planctomycetaceae bacterium]
MVLNAPRFLVVACLTGVLAGCENSDFDVATTSGTVVCNGETVTMGTVTFTPVGEGDLLGKPAIGILGPDGRFVLSTYGDGDGAVVGKHRVNYLAPEAFAEEEEPVDENSAEAAERSAQRIAKASAIQKLASCSLNEELILDVVAGQENDFTIVLSPGSPDDESEMEE